MAHNIKITTIILSIAFIVLAKNNSNAGGLPVRPGSLNISTSVSYFFANKGWDSLGVKSPFVQHGQFTSQSYSFSAEYGISRRLTFSVVLPYVVNDFHQDNFASHVTGLTDMEAGLRYYLFNIDYIYYFSLQGTFIKPLYTDASLGYAENGAEIKASFFGSGKVLGHNCYFSVDNGIRQYFGDTGPVQDRYSATFGLTLDQKKFKHQVSVSFGGFYSTSSFTQSSINQATNKNFSFSQAAISYGYAFSKRVSAFLSAGTFLVGRNTGDGSSASLSLIMKPF